MKPRLTIFLLLAAFSSRAFLPAQSTADEIETLLKTDAVTYHQAARFLLEASEAFTTSDSGEAFRFAVENKWLPKKALPDGFARLDEISLLLMRSFGLKGGLMYSLTKAPHFAYRELVYRRVITGRADPGMPVSGDLLLYITGTVFSMLGGYDTVADGGQK